MSITVRRSFSTAPPDARRPARDRRRGTAVALAPDAAARVDASRAIVDRQALGDTPVYGINTGFGALAETAIPRDALGALQVNLLRSHAAGVGDALPVRAVRAAMALRANVLAKGFSGIRRATLERLIDLLNRRVHPRVPSRGSVGASGDLAPLAHLSLVLIGEGEATVGDDADASGRARSAAAGTARRRCTLGPKEGSRSSTARNHRRPSPRWPLAGARAAGARGRRRGRPVHRRLRGSVRPFDARIHDARPYAGQVRSAANIRALLAGSADQQVARALRARAGRLLAALRGAGSWRGAGGARFVARRCS